MQVFILGMHGSGGSAVGQFVHLMGAKQIDDHETIMPNSAVDKDYWWSNASFYNVNSELMDEVLDFSSSIVYFDVDNIPPSPLGRFNKAAKELASSINSDDTVVISDPRNCLFLPLWLEHFDAPACIHVVNEPMISAEVLGGHYNCPRSESIALWEFYNKHAFACSKDLRRMVVTWQAIQDNPKDTLEMIRETLIDWGAKGLQPVDDKNINDIVTSFSQEPSEHAQDDYLNGSQAQFAKAVEDGSVLTWTDYFVSSGGTEMLTRFERSKWAEQQANEYEVLLVTQGLAALKNGENEKAETFAQVVLQADPGNPDALHLYGLARSMSGDNESAMKLISKSVEIRPDSAMTLNDLGMVYHLTGDDVKAKECFEKTLAINPDFQLAKNNLEQLAA
jgi:tetratricopeptide (TPR) repeat protein